MLIERHTLSNGLRVVAEHDRHTSMACVTVLYNVGARDEAPDATGMAHLFEHLMFGGSRHSADYDAPLEMAGGWSNAWTSNDFTMFYNVVPAANIATPFWLESDRMFDLNLSQRALDVQRAVVLEEFKQTCLNRPYGDMAHHLRSLLYKVHPYRYPTIGLCPEHIEDMTAERIKDFYRLHYAPNNAVLAVSGNVDPQRVFELAEKWFGQIPAMPLAAPSYPTEPPVTSPRRKEVKANVPHTQLTIAFPMGGYGSEHYIASDLLTDILASGNSSRLYRMVMQGASGISQADASIAGSEDPGFLMLNAQIPSSSPEAIDKAEKALWQQIELLTGSDVADDELQRVINRFESNLIFSHLSYIHKSQTLAMAEMHGESPNDLCPRYRAIIPQHILAAATHILRPDSSCTLIYGPE